MPLAEIRIYRAANGKSTFYEWLTELKTREPKAYKKCLAYITRLFHFGRDLTMPTSKPLGGGIYELRPKVGTVNYRMLYFFYGRDIACLSEGFTKEDKVPQAYIEEAKRRKKQVESDPETYTMTWE